MSKLATKLGYDLAEEVLAELLKLPGVKKGRVWNATGKQRVYIDLVKQDGPPGMNGDVGRTMYVDMLNGRTFFVNGRSWSGPETQAFHTAHRTVRAVQTVVRRFV